MDPTRILAERIRAGRSTIVVGDLPDLPAGVVALRVMCDQTGTTSVLDRARATIESELDHAAEPRRSARGGQALAAHRRLLAGDAEWLRSDVAFVDAANLLASRANGGVVLVLDAIDRADDESLRALAEIVRERGRLRLPLVLLSHGELSGALLELASAMREEAMSGPPLAAPPSSAEPLRSSSAAQSASAPRSAPPRASAPLPPLPDDVLRVLRAAALVGTTFDATTVSRLIEQPVDAVLEQLQRAQDHGVRVIDRGDNRFVLAEATAAHLVSSTSASLRDRWQAKLAEVLGTPSRATRSPVSRSPESDPLRAAAAFEAIGRTSAAIEQRLDAVARMIDAGDVARAAKTLEETRSPILGVTSLAARTLLDARARLERARLMWLTTSEPGAGTLSDAWTEALGAWRATPEKCSSRLRAYAAATLGAIAYDIGEGAALEQTREILSETVGALLQEGATIDAASLINEQAALELRRERVSAAAELLARSRRLFEARVRETAGDGAARAELADTDLLLARLPLHASPVDMADAPFVTNAGFAAALESARAAEHAFRALGMRREVARACDVLGRLEARRGDREGARAHLEEALRIAEELGDPGGLARATAALAELLAEAGKPEEALGLLRTSISVNREKGSALGLSFDAAALDVIELAVSRMGGAVETAMRPELASAREGLDDGSGPITSRVG